MFLIDQMSLSLRVRVCAILCTIQVDVKYIQENSKSALLIQNDTGTVKYFFYCVGTDWVLVPDITTTFFLHIKFCS